MAVTVIGPRTHCANCEHELRQILDLGMSPLADKFPVTTQQPEQYFPLRLMYCSECRLVQLGDVVPDAILWSDYGFFSSTSPALVKYHEDVARLLASRYPADGLTVEIACNDGSLLKRLPGARKVGIDAAKGPVEVGTEAGLDIHYGFFGATTAQELVDKYGYADLIVAQNVVAHVANLKDFFEGLKILLDDEGVAVIEFQALEDLLLGNQFDHIYHEHRFFFSAASFWNVASAAGFDVTMIERVPMQGGSLRATLKKGGGRLRMVPDEFITDPLSLMTMQSRAWYLRDRFNQLLTQELHNGTVAGYAASAKSTTLLNWCGVTSDQIQFIVDTTPHKIGRFSPGTKIPIVAPGERPDPDTYVLLVHNYLSRIRKESFQGRWLVPIPQPVII